MALCQPAHPTSPHLASGKSKRLYPPFGADRVQVTGNCILDWKIDGTATASLLGAFRAAVTCRVKLVHIASDGRPAVTEIVVQHD